MYMHLTRHIISSCQKQRLWGRLSGLRKKKNMPPYRITRTNSRKNQSTYWAKTPLPNSIGYAQIKDSRRIRHEAKK